MQLADQGISLAILGQFLGAQRDLSIDPVMIANRKQAFCLTPLRLCSTGSGLRRRPAEHTCPVRDRNSIQSFSSSRSITTTCLPCRRNCPASKKPLRLRPQIMICPRSQGSLSARICSRKILKNACTAAAAARSGIKKRASSSSTGTGGSTAPEFHGNQLKGEVNPIEGREWQVMPGRIAGKSNDTQCE